MIRNFLVIAARTFLRDSSYSIINISGLVVGLTCSIFIFLWVMDEITFDRFHADYDRIFQVMENNHYSNGEVITYDLTPAPLAEKLQTEFPEVEQTCRTTWPSKILFTAGQTSIYNEGFYADSSFFKFFTFPLIEGDINSLMGDHRSIVISQKMAAKYFKGSAVGKMIRMNKDEELKVTGVFKNVPGNSYLKFDFVLPFALYSRVASHPLQWGYHTILTYAKLIDESRTAVLQPKIKDILLTTNIENEVSYLYLFPMREWRLFGHFENGVPVSGRIFYVICFSLVAVFILIVACINFMNLATARAGRRSREVGIRKVAGASRGLLIRQFMLESMLLSFISLSIALLCAHLLTPLFNYLSNKNLKLNYDDPYLIFGLLGITLFTGLLAGSYPAFFLSSFRPASVLKGNLVSVWKGVGLRKTLVLIQFVLSVVLIVSAVVINNQVQYMRNKNLGFDKDDVMYFQPQPGSIRDFETFRNELLKNPLIQSVGQCSDHPMNIFNNDYARWKGMRVDEKVTVQTSECDANYLQTMRFTLVQGRFFSSDLASDSSSFLINETCANLMGVANPVGEPITVYKFKGKVIGVVKDFNHTSLHSKIEPIIFLLSREKVKPMTVYVRYNAGLVTQAVEHVERVYKKFDSVFPLEVSFLDKDIEYIYHNEIMIGRLSVCFMFIAIFISCLGLFGLTLFTTERRTKEIGVRKVLGASVQSLVVLLCGEFARPIIYSLVIGLPVGYYLMQKFLLGFPFHTELNIWIFLLTGVSLMAMALITVSVQSTRAALTNPADSLRTE